MWSMVNNTPVGNSQSPLFTPNTTGTLPRALFGVYTVTQSLGSNTASSCGGGLVPQDLCQITKYSPGNISALNSAISSSVAVALSVVPVASPASAVIQKKDPVTGGDLSTFATLGPIFTQRAETIGKGQFYIGISHQSFHFTKFNGQRLNGISMLDPGTNRISASVPTSQGGPAPATYNLATDVRLSQDIAFITVGLTNRVELSVGLPMVHAAVAATSYNAVVYSGSGTGGLLGPGNCWCINTLAPGTFQLSQQGQIGTGSMAKTGFGDLLIRAKGAVLSTKSTVISVGGDLRLPTGDADNYLGIGTAAAKPFAAVSFYKQMSRGFVFSPHFDVGWQFAGKSVLGGQITGSQQTATLNDGEQFKYLGAPLSVKQKDFIPDVFTWSAGAEWALGNRNTLVTDVLGNQIGWIHGAPQLQQASAQGLSLAAPYSPVNATGMVGVGKTSFSQYNGSFGYKTLVAGKLVASFNILIRLDDNSLTSRFSPLFGLSYTF
jgi:hypothetical protein